MCELKGMLVCRKLPNPLQLSEVWQRQVDQITDSTISAATRQAARQVQTGTQVQWFRRTSVTSDLSRAREHQLTVQWLLVYEIRQVVKIWQRFIAEATSHVSYDCIQQWQINGASVELSWCGSWWICPVNLALAITRGWTSGTSSSFMRLPADAKMLSKWAKSALLVFIDGEKRDISKWAFESRQKVTENSLMGLRKFAARGGGRSPPSPPVDPPLVYSTLWEVIFDTVNVCIQHAVSECCQTVDW